VVAGIVVGFVAQNPAGAAGLVAAGTALVIFYQSYQTRKAADATKADADASAKMLTEVQHDRELGVRPVIVLINSVADNGTLGVQVENVGRGPAIGLRIVQWHAGEVFWSQPATVAPGSTLPAGLETVYLMGTAIQWTTLEGHLGAASVDPDLAQRDHPNDLIGYCIDLLGNGLRFRLRVGEPPTVWRPTTEAEPPWATALKEPFDWRPANLRTSVPFDKVSQP
jgi:hypothetical protein